MDSRKIPGRKGIESQIIVVGGGGAGLSAALEVAEKGGEAIVIEKRRVLGGNTALASVTLENTQHNYYQDR